MGRSLETEKKSLVTRLSKGFPEIIWGLTKLFFDERAEEMGESLLRRINQAADLLLSESGMEIKLHPKDMKIVQGNLDFSGRQISLQSDSSVRQGGFIINSGYAELDGDVQSYLEKYIQHSSVKEE